MSMATRRRALRSWPLAVVIRRATHRVSSLAFGSVVVMRPCSSSDVQRVRHSALRASVSRLKWRPAFWCRIQTLAAQDRAHLFGLDEALLDELLLDLFQRLAAEVPARGEVFVS